jgi:hypothetical protein
MNTQNIGALALLATAALCSATLSAQNLVDFEKSAGNSTAKGTVRFQTAVDQNEQHFWVDHYMSTTHAEVKAKIFGKRTSVIDVGASALTHRGDATGKGATNEARTWLRVAGKDIHDRRRDRQSTWSYRRVIPIVGPRKKFGVGPFGVRVHAGLSAFVEPQIQAEVDRSAMRAETSAGGEVGLQVGATGSVSAGPAASLNVTSNLELASVELDLVGMVRPDAKDLLLQLTGNALRLHIALKLKEKVFGTKYSKTLVDERARSWTRRFDV